jgi:heptosyltransferase-2
VATSGVTRRLAIFAPNWLGDAVMALPALADVVRALPDAAIDLAARQAIAPLASMVPGLAGTVVLGTRQESIRRLADGHYDAALLLTNSFNTAWIAWRAGIGERWGYANELRSMLLTRAVAPPTRVHQGEFYQRLTTALGFDPGPLRPAMTMPAPLRSAGAARLSAAGWNGAMPLVALAPGAAFGGAKRWPAARFAGTIDALADDGIQCVLIGAPADAAAGAEVLASTRTLLRPLNLIAGTDLPTLAGVLVHCRALVTNDSGAMHFAAALGLNVTAIFGPTNQRETSPLGSGRMAVVHTDVWCRPCMLRECPLTHRCMTGIDVERVVQEIRSVL